MLRGGVVGGKGITHSAVAGGGELVERRGGASPGHAGGLDESATVLGEAPGRMVEGALAVGVATACLGKPVVLRKSVGLVEVIVVLGVAVAGLAEWLMVLREVSVLGEVGVRLREGVGLAVS